ncbi:SpoIIE family protein phosphatase, partial [Candidatus Poribacteria bacterium]|nr:SpoIIE family protein phosphatase [Candidatus Poribacteria bacterium]
YEIRNLRGEEFSPERIQRLLVQQISQPGTVLIDHVLTSIDQFSGGTPNDDDITVVAIDVNPAS